MSANKNLLQPLQQGDLFEAQTYWFHVFRAMIDGGELARMEGSTVKVYLVVKAHTNFNTGHSFPSHDLIARKSGLSLAQVKRCLSELESLGHICKKKVGRINHYTLREKVDIYDENGRPAAVATWDYLPSAVHHAVADLKNMLETGDLIGARVVNIERLQVQIILGENNAGLMVQESDLMKLAESNWPVFEKIMAMKEKSRDRSEKV